MGVGKFHRGSISLHTSNVYHVPLNTGGLVVLGNHPPLFEVDRVASSPWHCDDCGIHEGRTIVRPVDVSDYSKAPVSVVRVPEWRNSLLGGVHFLESEYRRWLAGQMGVDVPEKKRGAREFYPEMVLGDEETLLLDHEFSYKASFERLRNGHDPYLNLDFSDSLVVVPPRGFLRTLSNFHRTN